MLKMKITTITTTVFSLLIALSSFSVSAQKTQQVPLEEHVVADLAVTPKMALGLQKDRHIKGGFRFFDQLLESGIAFENFEIIIWGDVVKDLTKGSELARLIEENQHAKLRISICESAMNRLGVSHDELPQGATVVPNAFVRLLQIQANGYNVVVP